MIFSGFRAKFQKRVTAVAFQSNLRKQIRKLPEIENSEICENYSLSFIIIHYHSLLFICFLGPGRLPLDPRAGRAPRDLRLPAAGRHGARALGGREPRALRGGLRGARGPCAGIAIWN